MYVCLARDCVVHGTWISLGTATLRVFFLWFQMVARWEEEIYKSTIRRKNKAKADLQKKLDFKSWAYPSCFDVVDCSHRQNGESEPYRLRWFETLSRSLVSASFRWFRSMICFFDEWERNMISKSLSSNYHC